MHRDVHSAQLCRDGGALGKRQVNVMPQEAQTTKSFTGQLGSILVPHSEAVKTLHFPPDFPRFSLLKPISFSGC